MVVGEEVAFLVVHEAGARAALALAALCVDGDHAGERLRRDPGHRARRALQVLRGVRRRDRGRAAGGAVVVAVGRPETEGAADASRDERCHGHGRHQAAGLAPAAPAAARGVRAGRDRSAPDRAVAAAVADTAGRVTGSVARRVTGVPAGVRRDDGRGRRPGSGARGEVGLRSVCGVRSVRGCCGGCGGWFGVGCAAPWPYAGAPAAPGAPWCVGLWRGASACAGAAAGAPAPDAPDTPSAPGVVPVSCTGRRAVSCAGASGAAGVRGRDVVSSVAGSGVSAGTGGTDGTAGTARSSLPSFSVLTALYSSVPLGIQSAFGKKSAVHVSAVSFSHNASGHCKQDLCIRTPIFTSDKTDLQGDMCSATPTAVTPWPG